MNTSPPDFDADSAPDDDLDRLLRDYGASWREQLDSPPAARDLLTDLDQGHRRAAWYRRPLSLGVAAAVVVVALVLGTFLITKRGDSNGVNPPVAGSTSAPPVDSPTSATSLSSTVVENIAVPDLIGLDQGDAQSVLKTLGLKFHFTVELSDESQKGRVISQTPNSPIRVRPNSTVTLTIGAGQKYVTVPKGLKGLSYDDAAKKLQDASLKAAKTTTASVNPLNQVEGIANTGLVIKEGDAVPEGTVITLTVSDNSLMKMPTITGGSLDVAFAALQAAGWSGTRDAIGPNAFEDVTNRPQVGQVLKQSQPAGEAISKASPIQVTIGAAKQYIVPWLVGLSLDEAQARCSEAHFECAFDSLGAAPKNLADRGNEIQYQNKVSSSLVDFDQAFMKAAYYTPYLPPPNK